MKITASILVFISVAITYMSKNLFVHDIALALACLAFGASSFHVQKNKASLANPKLAKGITYFLATIICVIGLVQIWVPIADRFGGNTVVATESVKHFDKPFSQNRLKLLNIGQVYIGDSFNSYSFSLKNPDTVVLQEVLEFRDQQGPNKIFKMTIAPNSRYVLKAEVVNQ